MMPLEPPQDSEETLYQAARRFAQGLPGAPKRAQWITIETSNGATYRMPVPEQSTSPPPQPSTNSPSALPPRRRSPDCRSVHWDGCLYEFTAEQSQVVRLLWDAWENGTPDVAQETLRDLAKVYTSRLRDLFRKNPAWGALICKGKTQGSLRLGRIEGNAQDLRRDRPA